jgi:type II secretory pathway component GspD/PulD (secretin)
MAEYVRFASKICNVNFLFNEEDLQFTVSVVSDAPITPENVMATLVQLLRIHGLSLLEQDNNLVIHQSDDVKQLATLVTEDGKQVRAPLITRIFRLKNIKPDSLAAVVRPMLSKEAMLETSPDTRQVILTDFTKNVEKVAVLIENLDSPHTLLEIQSYEAQFNNPEYLIGIASQIMAPIAAGNPFIMVPQGLANSVFIVSTPELNQKTLDILKDLDTPPKKSVLSDRKLKTENIFVYKLQHRSGGDVLKNLDEIASNLHDAGIPDNDLIETIDSAKWIPESNTIMFVGSADALDKLKEFLIAVDSDSYLSGERAAFFVYKPQHRSAQEIQVAMEEMAKSLRNAKGADDALIDTLRSARINPSTQTIVFSGEQGTFAKVKELLATADTPNGRGKGKNQFFVYKIQKAPEAQIETSLRSFAKELDASGAADEGLVQAVDSVKYIRETHSLLFTGSEPALKRLQEIVPTFDTQLQPASSQFFIYKPKHQRGDQLAASLKDVTENLKKNDLSDPSLIRTLESMKWVKSTNSILFTGDAESIKKVEGLIANLDGTLSGRAAERNFFLYAPEFASREQIEAYLNQVADNLSKKGDDDLVETLRGAKWIEQSHSFIFHGPEGTLNRVKELLKNIDTPAHTAAKKSTYFIYKVQNTTGDLIEEDLDNLARNLKSSGVKNDKVLAVIDNIRYVKETNSLLLTGDPDAIEEVKALIAKYDYPREAGPNNSNFYLYKPQHVKASELEKSFKDIASNLRKADLADPSLLATLESFKYVESTNSFIFTGPPDALQKVQALIKEIDVPAQRHAPIQHIGKTTFLLYKLRQASGPQITSSIQAIAQDLKATGVGDPDFLAALGTMKYVKETNSLMFTGTEEALTKVQALVEKFDVSALGPQKVEGLAAGAPNFFMYKPQSLTGPDLEKIIQDFAENLKASGLADPELFHAVNSMRWVEKSQSLLFTGTPKALDQIKELLRNVDIPANLPGAPPAGGPLEPSIQAIDNTSFLVYKLQFHKGDEIQGALRQIAKDLIVSNAPINQNLLNSINSIQWLEVTNSLLCSGDQETLTRLRELIKNLDIPLKQVFIEMLVIETSMTNALTFGLEWGGKYKYRNKFSGSINNLIPQPGGVPDNSMFTNSGLQGITATNTPTPAMIPLNANGFDLGIIGEIIKHNGQSFLSLGSLLNALQTDNETTIVMTPKIITQDGKTSSIFIGQNVPFAGSFVSNITSNTTNTANIEYRDIGFNLTITPVLGNSDIVTLDISLDSSAIAADQTGNVITNGTGQSVSGITTTKATMDTTVHVPDQHFLVLSGMVNNSATKAATGLPCLGGLPLVGAAFSSKTNTDSAANIVIFIRPHIINSLEDMRKVTAEQEEFFHDQAGTPLLEHQFDDSMELIKRLDDE